MIDGIATVENANEQNISFCNVVGISHVHVAYNRLHASGNIHTNRFNPGYRLAVDERNQQNHQ